jgi:hypothetical protein
MTRLRKYIFPRCDYFRDFHSATWTIWESAPDVGFESNAIARHHTQLKMANRRQFHRADLENDARRVSQRVAALRLKTS